MVPGASSGAMVGQQAAGHLCRPRLDSLDANEIPWFVWYGLMVLHSRSEVLPGASARFHPQAHQARVSALSGRDMIPIRPVMREPLAEEPVRGPGFPLPFGHWPGW